MIIQKLNDSKFKAVNLHDRADTTPQAIPHLPRTLIADDEPDILIALRLLLKSEGYQAETVSSPAAVLEAISRSQFDVVLMDLNYARDTTSGREGLDLISRIQAGPTPAHHRHDRVGECRSCGRSDAPRCA